MYVYIYMCMYVCICMYIYNYMIYTIICIPYYPHDIPMIP